MLFPAGFLRAFNVLINIVKLQEGNRMQCFWIFVTTGCCVCEFGGWGAIVRGSQETTVQWNRV